jgi:ABC-type multidrug transport system ATPase subunit
MAYGSVPEKGSPAMLELRGISKYYSGIPVVNDVSFSARPGEVTGYLGPNGSGKTTTMKIVTGLIEMAFGQVLFQGKPIQDDLIGYKRRMGQREEALLRSEVFLTNHDVCKA